MFLFMMEIAGAERAGRKHPYLRNREHGMSAKAQFTFSIVHGSVFLG